MPWIRFDEGYLSHEKLEAAGWQAAYLDSAGIQWCAHRDNLTDGRIEKTGRKFEKFVLFTMMPAATLRKLAAVLVDVKRWEDHGDHWQIHDYLDFQPSRDDVLTEQENARLRQRRKRDRDREANSPSRRDNHGDVTDDYECESQATVPNRTEPYRSALNVSAASAVIAYPAEHRVAAAETAEKIGANQCAKTRRRVDNPPNWIASAVPNIHDKHYEAILAGLLAGDEPQAIADRIEPPLKRITEWME